MEPYLGMIFLFGGNFAIYGFQMCNGQTLAISQNQALFSVIGTYYGGNGVQTFQLPDLRGRVPRHQGNGVGLSPYVLGESAGAENAALQINNMPLHSHTFNVYNGTSTSGIPTSASYLARGEESGSGPAATYQKLYATTTPNLALGGQSIGTNGGNVPFPILSPYLVVTYLIAMVGIFPSRN